MAGVGNGGVGHYSRDFESQHERQLEIFRAPHAHYRRRTLYAPISEGVMQGPRSVRAFFVSGFTPYIFQVYLL